MESAVNEPHPDDTTEEEAFFNGGQPSGLPDLTPEQAKAEAAAYAAEKGEIAAAGTAEDAAQQYTDEVEAEHARLEAQEGAQGPATPAATPDDAQAQEGAETPGDAPTDAKSNADRDYIVLHRVPLTEVVLKHLVEEIRSGIIAEARLAYLELDVIHARNDRTAVATAYGRHKDRLGEKADLAAVTARGFKVRHVEPKQRVHEDLVIS